MPKKTTKRGVAIILPGGERRIDYIRNAYYRENLSRADIVKALKEAGHEVSHQSVYQATRQGEQGKAPGPGRRAPPGGKKGSATRAWISTTAPGEATGRLAELYERVKTPHGTVDNVMRVHSLRPESLEGHLILYKSVLHNEANTLALWFLEAVATWVSLTNRCYYSTTHHSANMRRLIADESRAQAIYAALACGRPETAFEGKELALLDYARKLTAEVGAMCEADIARLREAGADDGEILEVNQVCAYFNYSNRVLNGLGVTIEGDVIGYYRRPDTGA